MNLVDDALRSVVRQAVAGFDARSQRELESQRRILAEMDRLADPFDRHAGPVHLTGSGIVSGPRGTVLHMHRSLHLWLQPGGHLEAGEPPWGAALREAAEETGLPVRHPPGGPRLVHLDAHPANAHFHLDLRYLLLSDDAEPAPAAGESQEVRWFSLDEAIAIADPGLVDGLRRLARMGRARSSGPEEMSKLKLDLHEIYNRGGEIDRALREVMQEAVRIKAKEVEIIPGKGSGQLKKRVVRFLETPEMRALYHRIEKDKDNWGRVFVYFRWK